VKELRNLFVRVRIMSQTVHSVIVASVWK